MLHVGYKKFHACVGMALADLFLGYCSNITDGGLAELCGMPLRCLSLVSCWRTTDHGLAELEGGLEGGLLEELDLGGCDQVTTDGVLALVADKPLKRLGLVGCSGVTERILPALYGLPLAVLRVMGGQFSAAGLEELQEAFTSMGREPIEIDEEWESEGLDLDAEFSEESEDA